MAKARKPMALTAWLAIALASAPLAAQQADQAEPEPPSIEEIAVMLGAPDSQQVQEAIEASAMLGDPGVVPLLEQRIREGLPASLLTAALDALSLLNSPSSKPILEDLTFHRDPAVRVRAVQGLAALGPKHAADSEPALVRALGDGEASVRAAAARAMGELGMRSSMPTLFTAFERGVAGSGEAIAKLASKQHLDRIFDYMGVYPFQNVAPILQGLLEREDWKDQAKLRVVAQLQELATPDARAVLENVANADPKQVSMRVRSAAADAAQRISVD